MNALGWTFVETLYFLMVTASTVGYGDLNPTLNLEDHEDPPSATQTRTMTVLFIFVGICVVFARLSVVVGALFKPIFSSGRNAIERCFPQPGIDIDGDGTADFKVPRSSFVYYSKNLLAPLVVITLIQLLCALIFAAIEPNMFFGDALYHCIVTATTVGYGDVAIETDSGRIFAFFHILVSVSLLAAIIGDIGQLAAEREAALKRLAMFESKLDVDMMASLDQDGNGVDKFEFVTGMLLKLKILEAEDVNNFVKLFEELDTDGSGTLTRDDMEATREMLSAKRRASNVDAAKVVRMATSIDPAMMNDLMNGMNDLTNGVNDLTHDLTHGVNDLTHDLTHGVNDLIRPADESQTSPSSPTENQSQTSPSSATTANKLAMSTHV